MVTSGCTGWAPNAARLLTAGDIMGEWTLHPNPCVGKDAEHIPFSKHLFITVQGKKMPLSLWQTGGVPIIRLMAGMSGCPCCLKQHACIKVVRQMGFGHLRSDESGFQRTREIAGYQLVWNEEFNYEGVPDPEVWTHEKGYVRNEEYQWYQPDNAVCSNGVLVISGQKEENRKNPNYEPNSRDWRKNREFINYTASSIKTQGKKAFQYGRFEIRARIPTAGGSWPAIWTLGESMRWPFCGEIDIMEYYRINGCLTF